MRGLDPEFKLRTYSKSYLEISKAKAPACLVPRDRLVRSASKFDKQLEAASYSLKSRSIGRRDYVNLPNINLMDDIVDTNHVTLLAKDSAPSFNCNISTQPHRSLFDRMRTLEAK
jgi:hypothetical protein